MTMPARRLPRALPPFHDETVDSYVTRLAPANALTASELVAYLGVRPRKKTPRTDFLTPLSVVTGLPADTLRLALPEFMTDHVSDEPGHIGRPLALDKPRTLKRPACRRCVRAAGIDEAVTCWTTHDRNVCRRHRLWIGGGCNQPEDQIDISMLPSTVSADRHHRNLITRHGRRWVSDAFPDARDIFLGLIRDQYADPFGLVAAALEQLRGQDNRPVEVETALMVLFHPQIVTLTGLLACPTWEQRAMQSGDIDWLIREITMRDVLIGYVPHDKTDPLIDWVTKRFATHKFVARHGWHLYKILFPEETVQPLPAPGARVHRRTSPIRFGYVY
ncbi:hypothetical protein GCM10010430_02160 [Kitasatospora cystarginea]|uniref:TniQ domain-containing protein n=2 Tax=Kitasatospora cystarginea TaxID=58350 RepID=A0ABN3DBQ6_9ACTN